MQIRRLNASFGKLNNETLKLHPGLNVIYAPNESGKSTWCAFIRAMFYGVDSSQRSRAGFLPDKQRYAPWSGAPMEGTMELNANGQDITLTRMTKSKNAPMQDFSAVYTGTNTPVEGLNGTNCGELLTGVNREVFRRSAFVEQGAVGVSGNPELEKRISAIVSTGEEACSYSEADATLRAWQRKRRFNRRGLIPELEGNMDETQRRLDALQNAVQEQNALELQLEESRRLCSELEAQVTEARKKQRRDSLDSLRQGREAVKLHSERHDAALHAVTLCRDSLRRGQFQGESIQTVEQTVHEDLSRLRELQEDRGRSCNLLLPILFFILSAVCAGIYTQLQQLYVIVPAVFFCVAAVVFILRWASAQSRRRDCAQQQQEILLRYRAEQPQELSEALEAHRKLWADMARAERIEQESRRDYEQAREQLEALEAGALEDLDFSGGNSPAALLSRQLSAQREHTQQLSSQLASLQGRLAVSGDPLVLSSELARMEEEYDGLLQEYAALALAVEALQQADAQLQSRFAPRLGRLAGDYLALVTGGRYADIFIDRNFSAKIRLSGESITRESEYLSAGTLDLMYLALRLAVCELALPEGKDCPLIIDDALVNLDEQRLSQAMELLREIAKTRQVILFTCREPKNPDPLL